MPSGVWSAKPHWLVLSCLRQPVREAPIPSHSVLGSDPNAPPRESVQQSFFPVS